MSGLTIILFHLNRSVTARLAALSVEKTFSIVLSPALIVLSSAKFNRSAFVVQGYKLFRNILKRSGSSIKRLETPDKSAWNIVSSYILIPIFQVWVEKSGGIFSKSISKHFHYEKINNYGVKTFDKSIKTTKKFFLI